MKGDETHLYSKSEASPGCVRSCATFPVVTALMLPVTQVRVELPGQECSSVVEFLSARLLCTKPWVQVPNAG